MNMLRRPDIFLVFALAALAPADMLAQQALSNDDLLRMIREGKPELEIVCAIEGSEADYEISATSLIELKQSGAGPLILNAMLRRAGGLESDASRSGKATSPRDTSLIVGDSRFKLRRAEQSWELRNRLFTNPRSYLYLAGAASAVRITGASAEFEVSLPFVTCPI